MNIIRDVDKTIWQIFAAAFIIDARAWNTPWWNLLTEEIFPRHHPLRDRIALDRRDGEKLHEDKPRRIVSSRVMREYTRNDRVINNLRIHPSSVHAAYNFFNFRLAVESGEYIFFSIPRPSSAHPRSPSRETWAIEKSDFSHLRLIYYHLLQISPDFLLSVLSRCPCHPARMLFSCRRKSYD